MGEGLPRRGISERRAQGAGNQDDRTAPKIDGVHPAAGFPIVDHGDDDESQCEKQREDRAFIHQAGDRGRQGADRPEQDEPAMKFRSAPLPQSQPDESAQHQHLPEGKDHERKRRHAIPALVPWRPPSTAT